MILTLATNSAYNVGESNTAVTWTSVPGRTYYVASKSSASDPYWSDLSGPIVATGADASWVDEATPPGAQRIYRVVVSWPA